MYVWVFSINVLTVFFFFQKLETDLRLYLLHSFLDRKKCKLLRFFQERAKVILGPNDLGKCIGPVNFRQVLWLNIISFPKNLMQQFVDPVSLKSVASWVWKGNNRNIYWKNVNIFSLRLYNSEIVKL